MASRPIITLDDASALLRSYLMGVDALTAQVGDRIRTDHILDPDVVIRYPMLIVERRTGFGGYQGGIHRLGFEIYAYSDESPAQADRVYDLMYLALQGARLRDPAGVLVAAGSAREVERPERGYNDQTRSWWARGTWSVTIGGGSE